MHLERNNKNTFLILIISCGLYDSSKSCVEHEKIAAYLKNEILTLNLK